MFSRSLKEEMRRMGFCWHQSYVKLLNVLPHRSLTRIFPFRRMIRLVLLRQDTLQFRQQRTPSQIYRQHSAILQFGRGTYSTIGYQLKTNAGASVNYFSGIPVEASLAESAPRKPYGLWQTTNFPWKFFVFNRLFECMKWCTFSKFSVQSLRKQVAVRTVMVVVSRIQQVPLIVLDLPWPVGHSTAVAHISICSLLPFNLNHSRKASLAYWRLPPAIVALCSFLPVLHPVKVSNDNVRIFHRASTQLFVCIGVLFCVLGTDEAI